jgi:Tol biopolymer transport system component
VAFIDHPVLGDTRGSVQIATVAGERRKLSDDFKAVWGLAWAPGGREIWFSASQREAMRTLFAIDLRGRQRVLLRVPLRLALQDVSRDGTKALVSGDSLRRSTFGLAPDESHERDLSWLDYSNAKDLSPDGRTLLFSEDGEGGGAAYAVYLRRTDGTPAIRLGEGKATALSPDGRWALAIRVEQTPHRLIALPTRAGEPVHLAAGSLERYDWAMFFPDGRRLLLAASEPGGKIQLWVQDFPSGTPRAIGGEGVGASFGGLALSPDGTRVAAVGPDRQVLLYPLGGGAAQPLPGAETGEVPIQWSQDGAGVYVFQPQAGPARIDRLDVRNGTRESVLKLTPADPSGVLSITRVRMTRDARAYVYTFSRILSDLFLVEGLR